MFENYIDSLFNDKIILKSQQRFKSDHHEVYTEEVHKIGLSSNNNKRLQTFVKNTTHPYGINVFKVYESEMIIVKDLWVEKYVDCPFYNKVTTHSYGANVFKVCESVMMIVKDLFVEKYMNCLFYDEIILQRQRD